MTPERLIALQDGLHCLSRRMVDIHTVDDTPRHYLVIMIRDEVTTPHDIELHLARLGWLKIHSKRWEFKLDDATAYGRLP